MQRISVPSRRKGRTQSTMHPWGRVISTHTLRMEGDIELARPRPVAGISTHALREEGDIRGSSTTHGKWYFYPRPPRGGRQGPLPQKDGPSGISTHALREEGDRCGYRTRQSQRRFLPTPSARRATKQDILLDIRAVFLPTPSARRATCTVPGLGRSRVFLPTPSARRATCTATSSSFVHSAISTHALREEGDANYSFAVIGEVYISTHALREEGNGDNWDIHRLQWYFYPRPPRGGRPPASRSGKGRTIFLPTPSARRAT